MSKWALMSIDELGRIDRGRSRHRPRDDKSLYGGAYPFIQTGEVKAADFFITNFTQTYNDVGLAQSKLWPEGTLCITIAANIADAAILSFPACFPDSIVGFTSGSEGDVRFVKYLLDISKPTIEAISRGTTQDNLSLEKIRRLRFKVPPPPIQKKIAAILSAYDELIENNNRRIALLEKMAEEIYREWFVRMRFPGHEKTKFHKGIPEGWEVKSFADIGDYINGFAFAPEDWKEEGLPIVKIREIKQGIGNDTPRNSGENVPQRLHITSGDILFSWSGSLEVVIWEYGNALLNQHLFKVIPQKNVSKFFLFQALLSAIPHFDALTTGATMKHIKRKELKHVELVCPAEKIMEQFHHVYEGLYSEKSTLFQQNTLLKQTRDALLPRLMSGKLDVEKLDIAFPPGMQN